MDLLTITTIGVSMGRCFRTIDVELIIKGCCSNAATLYYLLTPVNTPEPTVDQIIGFNDQGLLASGRYARGALKVRCCRNIVLSLSGRQVPSPYPDETGVVDGYRYAIYVVAKENDRESEVTFMGTALGMPFAGGKGTRECPYEIEEINVSNLCEHPDLLPGHCLNRTGAIETARMLQNIERLQKLYHLSCKVDGLKNSLCSHYILKSDIDLSNYHSAYHGKGWKPIGSGKFGWGGVFSGAFKGSFDGNGHIICNLSITEEFGSPAGNCFGLFGLLKNALIKDLVLKDVKICVTGEPAYDRLFIAGALAGHAFASTIKDVCVKNVEIGFLPGETTYILPALLGCVIGLITKCCSLCNIQTKCCKIKTDTEIASLGGLAGQVILWQNSWYEDQITMLQMPSNFSNERSVTLQERLTQLSRMLKTEIGENQTFENDEDGLFLPTLQGISCIKNIKCDDTTTTLGFDDNLVVSGGLFGGVLVFGCATCIVESCKVKSGCIAGGFAGGGLAGISLVVCKDTGCFIINGCCSEVKVRAKIFAGGLAGALFGQSERTCYRLNRCLSSCNVKGDSWAGGLSSVLQSVCAIACEAKTRVKAELCSGFGTLIENSDITDCSAIANVTSLDEFGAGFASLLDESNLTRCIFSGVVNSSSSGSGLVGLCMQSPEPSVIQNCFVLRGKVDAEGSPLNRILNIQNNAILTDNFALADFTLCRDEDKVCPFYVGADKKDGKTVCRGKLENQLCKTGFLNSTYDLSTIKNLGRPVLKLNLL